MSFSWTLENTCLALSSGGPSVLNVFHLPLQIHLLGSALLLALRGRMQRPQQTLDPVSGNRRKGGEKVLLFFSPPWRGTQHRSSFVKQPSPESPLNLSLSLFKYNTSLEPNVISPEVLHYPGSSLRGCNNFKYSLY